MTIQFGPHHMTWLGYACIRIEGPDETVVYTDPGRYGTLTGTWADQYGGMAHPSGPEYAPEDGDLVLVTHDHHYDSDGIQRVASDDGTVLLFDEIDAERIRNGGRDVRDPLDLGVEVRRVGTEETHEIEGVTIETLPAYNRPDGRNVRADGSPIHPKGFGCGYQFSLAGRSFCWPGDSDVLPVHRDLDVSVLLPSIASSFTMNRHDVAKLVDEIVPDLVVPIHYNTFRSLTADSRAFAGDVAAHSVPVALDERGFID